MFTCYVSIIYITCLCTCTWIVVVNFKNMCTCMYNAASMNISIENASPNAQGNHLRGYGLGEGGIRTLL